MAIICPEAGGISMNNTRKFERNIDRCFICPNWKRFGETRVFICEETGKEISPKEARNKIYEKCPLPKLNNLESAIKDILEEE